MSRNRLHRFLSALVFIAAAAGWTGANAQFSNKPADATGSVVTTPQVRAELLAHAPDGVAPGKPVWLGLQLTHQKDWHTYWKNPGDSGLPTELTWQLPAGLDVGETAWPVPSLFRIGKLANYGYGGQVLLAAPLQVPTGFTPACGQPTARSKCACAPPGWRAAWNASPKKAVLCCNCPCAAPPACTALPLRRPRPRSPCRCRAKAISRSRAMCLQLRVSGLPQSVHGQQLEVFAEPAAVLIPAAVPGKDWTQSWQGDTWTANLPLSPDRGASLAQMALVLAPAPGQRPAATATAPPAGTPWPPSKAPGHLPPPRPACRLLWPPHSKPTVPPATAPQAAPGLAAGRPAGRADRRPAAQPHALRIPGAGYQGDGLCPPRQQPGARSAWAAWPTPLAWCCRSWRWAACCWPCARRASNWAGAFRPQSPGVVAVLAVLFTLIGLNLAGVFEFGQFVPGRLATPARHPAGDAFLTGVLAVAIASPCTAPFMGAALGFAIDMPAPQALAVFAALGVGMAVPYLLAAWVPAVARWLPRPGAWMDTFRRAMAFPMFATVVWLVWVLGQQSGIDGAGARWRCWWLAARWCGHSRCTAAPALLLLLFC